MKAASFEAVFLWKKQGNLKFCFTFEKNKMGLIHQKILWRK